MKPITQNDLLQAIMDAQPLAPSAEWMTRKEIAAATKLTVCQISRRLMVLQKSGKAEKLRAPGRQGHGLSVYYRLKP